MVLILTGTQPVVSLDSPILWHWKRRSCSISITSCLSRPTVKAWSSQPIVLFKWTILFAQLITGVKFLFGFLCNYYFLRGIFSSLKTRLIHLHPIRDLFRSIDFSERCRWCSITNLPYVVQRSKFRFAINLLSIGKTKKSGKRLKSISDSSGPHKNE